MALPPMFGRNSRQIDISYIDRWADYFDRSEHSILDCEGFLAGNESALNQYIIKGRLVLDVHNRTNIPLDCDSIKSRILGNKIFKKLDRPISFIRNVYKTYELQEAFLSMSYHPDNWYCFAVDKNSTEYFKKGMLKASLCLENVVVLDQEFDFDSAGHRQDKAHFACLEKIRHKNWFHALLLQNDDLIIKSADEIAQISKLMNTSSGMGIHEPLARWNTTADWTPKGLKLFKNESSVSETILNKPLVVRKDLNEVFLSRVFVNAIFDNLNLGPLLDLFDHKDFYGVDEMLAQTLYTNYLGLDGQMESECWNVEDITRWTHWNWNGNFDGPTPACLSQWKRHRICILGIEYMHELRDSNFIIGNKIQSDYDFGTVICTAELLSNRTRDGISSVQPLFYNVLPQVREVHAKRKGTYDKSKFVCYPRIAPSL